MSENKTEAFKNACKAYLFPFGLSDLRSYGREIGVFRPTDKKKDDLLDQIVSILSGELTPIEKNKKGAPLKNTYVPPEIPEKIASLRTEYFGESPEGGAANGFEEFDIQKFRNRPREMMVVKDGSADQVEMVNGQRKVYRGQLCFSERGYEVLPLNCIDNGEQIFLSERLVKDCALREGDVISFFGVRVNDVLKATEILSVNDRLIGDFKRNSFEECTPCCPSVRIRTYDKEKSFSPTAKYLHWLVPLGLGQRIGVFSAPKAGKTTLLCRIAECIRKIEPELVLFAALIDQSPETVWKYRQFMDKDNLVYATFDENSDRQVFIARFLLERAKRFAESGKNVVLIIDSVSALARAYNELEESSGGKVLPCGLESRTLHFIKKYLGSARCFEEGGSITVLGAITTDSGNPADDYIGAELSAVSNAEIRLSNELAVKRIYPTIDLRKTLVKDGELLQTEEEIALESYIRSCYLSEKGEAALVDALTEACDWEEFKNLIKNA